MSAGVGTAWAIVPAGGRGERFSSTEDKLLAVLGGVPVLLRTLEALLSNDAIEAIVVAAAPDCVSAYRKAVSALVSPKPLHWVAGGATRRDSVYQALRAVPESVEMVVVHDAARPLLSPDVLQRALAPVLSDTAVGTVVALPLQDTVKQVDPETGEILTTWDRETLWRAQTPQVFKREPLLAAHRQAPLDPPVTDDAQLLERLGLGPVLRVVGEACNVKITTPEDLAWAAAYLETVLSKTRTGGVRPVA